MSGEGAGPRRRFYNALVGRFVIRFHLALILGFVLGASVLSNLTLRAVGLDHLVWRTALVCLLGYVAFFVAVRLWLSFLFARGSSLPAAVPDPKRLAHGGRDDSGFSRELGDLGDLGDLDEGALFVAVLLIALFALIALWWLGGFVLSELPLLLADVAFDAALSGGLVRAVTRFDRGGAVNVRAQTWIKPLLLSTIRPFMICFALVVGTALAAHVACDAPRRLAACFQAEG